MKGRELLLMQASSTHKLSHLRQGAIVPHVAMVGKAVVNKAQLAFLYILFDGIEGLRDGNLREADSSNLAR